MGSGKFVPVFPLVLGGFVREFFVVWAPKWSLGVFHGQDLDFVNEWLTQNDFKIFFEGLMNEAGG